MESRADLLAKVARFELPIETTLVMLRAYGWSSDRELYIITSLDVQRVIDRFLSCEISSEQLQRWAELIEMRVDLGYDEHNGDLLRRIVSRLANPETNGIITSGLMTQIQSLLRHPG